MSPMLASQFAFISAFPIQTVAPGVALLHRSVPAGVAVFIESGRVVLGIAAVPGLDPALADKHSTKTLRSAR